MRWVWVFGRPVGQKIHFFVCKCMCVRVSLSLFIYMYMIQALNRKHRSREFYLFAHSSGCVQFWYRQSKGWVCRARERGTPPSPVQPGRVSQDKTYMLVLYCICVGSRPSLFVDFTPDYGLYICHLPSSCSENTLGRWTPATRSRTRSRVAMAVLLTSRWALPSALSSLRIDVSYNLLLCICHPRLF